jgi:two-component system, NarL family, nitrate/nitrite response regulator NarL
MTLSVITPVRIVGEGILACLTAANSLHKCLIHRDFSVLRNYLGKEQDISIAIVDVGHAKSLDAVGDFHHDFPDIPLLALGVRECETDIITHAYAGFTGYIGCDEGLEQLVPRVEDALAGRLSCPPEVAAGLMRRLFELRPQQKQGSAALTGRENGVADLISRGLSNKEIARHLSLSESTVKHHVHAILGKLQLGSRHQLMHHARADMWNESWSERTRA